ncbi:MAG: hypothetical protein P8M25_14265, partial [Paracoccaceae bacterium]|nr:hypothetical protein [Paracoccaceae bacterium]
EKSNQKPLLAKPENITFWGMEPIAIKAKKHPSEVTTSGNNLVAKSAKVRADIELTRKSKSACDVLSITSTRSPAKTQTILIPIGFFAGSRFRIFGIFMAL